MITSTSKIFILFVCLLSINCNFSNHKNETHTIKINFIDSLRQVTNNAVLTYYVDFLNSKMEWSDEPFIKTKSGLDTIFSFIGNNKIDSCRLGLNVIPDGAISFYNDSTLVAQMQFVLNDTCNGFYTDFTRTPKKYKLTKLGETILLQHKNKTFQQIKMNK